MSVFAILEAFRYPMETSALLVCSLSKSNASFAKLKICDILPFPMHVRKIMKGHALMGIIYNEDNKRSQKDETSRMRRLE